MIKRLVLSLVLVLLAACSGKVPVTPTSVPIVLPTALPTKESFAYPTPIPCNTVVGNNYIQTKLETLANAKEVRVMEIHQGYSLFWADGGQICTSVDRNNVYLYTYYVTTDGLTDYQFLDGYTSEDVVANWQYNGKAEVEYAGDTFDNANHVTIRTPMTVGPNDAVVMAAWPIQQAAVKAAVRDIFIESPVYFSGTGWEVTPQEACDEMARWEGFAPLPENIYPICHKGYNFWDGYPHQWLIDPPYGMSIFTAYMLFMKSPDPAIFEGQLKAGQKLGDYTVEETCVRITEDQIRQTSGFTMPWFNNYKEPVGIRLSGPDWHSEWYITVPRTGVVGFGPIDGADNSGQGWHLFSVCP